MSTLLNFGRDVQGYNAYAPQFCKDKFSVSLPSDGNSSFTIPSNYQNWIVAFSYQPGSVIWIANNGTAAAPGGTSFTSTTSELLPAGRSVKAGDVINCYNHGSNIADIGVLLYAVS